MADITSEELKERIDKGEPLNVIDVREVDEYAEYNIGAINIPLGELPGRLAEFEHLKGSEIIVHCRSGARSANAKMFLLDAGFVNVRNLLGGMLEWQTKY
jgi:rhodanese-related sulfurtransferase